MPRQQLKRRIDALRPIFPGSIWRPAARSLRALKDRAVAQRRRQRAHDHDRPQVRMLRYKALEDTFDNMPI